MTSIVSGDITQLTNHSQHLATLSDGFARCLDAAREVSTDETADAYGVLCSGYIIPSIQEAEETILSALEYAMKTLTARSDAARVLADTYRSTDDDNADGVGTSWDGSIGRLGDPEAGDPGVGGPSPYPPGSGQDGSAGTVDDAAARLGSGW